MDSRETDGCADFTVRKLNNGENVSENFSFQFDPIRPIDFVLRFRRITVFDHHFLTFEEERIIIIDTR